MIFFYPVRVVYLLIITTKKGGIVMKKIIFLLLLAQTISFLYADSGCIGYRRYQGTDGALQDPADKNAWRWGVKSPMKIQCYCNCAKYLKSGNKCLECRHMHIPVALPTTEESVKLVHTSHSITKADKKQTQHKKSSKKENISKKEKRAKKEKQKKLSKKNKQSKKLVEQKQEKNLN